MHAHDTSCYLRTIERFCKHGPTFHSSYHRGGGGGSNAVHVAPQQVRAGEYSAATHNHCHPLQHSDSPLLPLSPQCRAAGLQHSGGTAGAAAAATQGARTATAALVCMVCCAVHGSVNMPA